jgi:hypothetical protein
MAFKVMDAGGVLRTITRMRVLDGANLRTIVRMKVMDSDDTTLRTVATFAQPLTLGAVDVYQGASQSILSGSSTATPVGGLGPYTYAWSYLSGTAMTVTGASAATATFTSPALDPGQSVFAHYRCTCTDSSGQTATKDITVVFEFFAPPGLPGPI